MNDDDQRLARWLARWQAPPADPAAKARLKAAIGTALPPTVWQRQMHRWRDWLEDVRSGGLSMGYRFAWRHGIRSLGLLLALLAGLVVAGLAIIRAQSPTVIGNALLTVDVVLPLIMGMAAALVFAPEDEPALELLLASPRPARWLLHERLTILIGLQGGIALLASWVAAQGAGVGIEIIITRWFAPLIAVSGTALAASIYGRRSNYGVLWTIVLVGGMAATQGAFLARFPDLWRVAFYILPGELTADQYALNRLILIAIGGAGIALAFLRTGQTEALFGAGHKTGG